MKLMIESQVNSPKIRDLYREYIENKAVFKKPQKEEKWKKDKNCKSFPKDIPLSD